MRQTVEIPAHPKDESLRITLDIPPEIPTGRGILTFTPASAVENDERDTAEPPAIAALKKEAVQKAARRFADPSGDALQRFCGSLAHIYTEDGVVIQRRMRAVSRPPEWER
jgi:hypothetical protein